MDPNKIQIPKCYRGPVLAWMDEFARGAQSEEDKVEVMKAEDLCLMPCVTSNSIVFALCRIQDRKMVRALKLERNAKADAVFVIQMMAAFNVQPIK